MLQLHHTPRLLVLSLAIALLPGTLGTELVNSDRCDDPVPSSLVAVPEANLLAVTYDAAEARDNWYAVIGLWNNTERATIQYYFRWGDREWKSETVRPGERRWHAWHFASANQTRWPAPQIRYDTDVRTGIGDWTTVHLHANAAPERGYWYGNRYMFRVTEDGRSLTLGRVFDDPAPR